MLRMIQLIGCRSLPLERKPHLRTVLVAPIPMLHPWGLFSALKLLEVARPRKGPMRDHLVSRLVELQEGLRSDHH